MRSSVDCEGHPRNRRITTTTKKQQKRELKDCNVALKRRLAKSEFQSSNPLRKWTPAFFSAFWTRVARGLHAQTCVCDCGSWPWTGLARPWTERRGPYREHNKTARERRPFAWLVEVEGGQLTRGVRHPISYGGQTRSCKGCEYWLFCIFWVAANFHFGFELRAMPWSLRRLRNSHRKFGKRPESLSFGNLQ